MKKIEKVCLSLILVGTLFIMPYRVEAKTIKEFEEEVEKFTKDLEEKQSKIAQNDEEVAKIKAIRISIEAQISDLEAQAESLQQEIDESNAEIAKKSQESKELFQYLQVSEGENAYLEYVFGATSITDMVYRMAIVEQLTDYNNQVMEELNALIESNKVKKQELETKNEELNQLTAELESEKERINADTQSIKEAMPSVQQQLKSAQDNLNYYKNLGCGVNEDIYACQYRIEQSQGGSGALVPSADGFYRPMVSGYVTQNWSGYRGHLGIDLSNSNKTQEIYAIADGVIFSIYTDPDGALCIKIRHNVGGRYIYSTYAHLSSYANISVGQVVTPNTLLGRMGNTGNSRGAHLHLEITTCDWHSGGGCTWDQYQRSTINPRQYISFPTTLRDWWNSR